MKSYKSRWRRKKKIFRKWVKNQRVILTLKIFPQTLLCVKITVLLMHTTFQKQIHEIFFEIRSKIQSISVFNVFLSKWRFALWKLSVRTFEHFGGIRATKLSWERISWFFFSWEVASAAAQFFLLQHDDVFSASQPWTWQCFSKKSRLVDFVYFYHVFLLWISVIWKSFVKNSKGFF